MIDDASESNTCEDVHWSVLIHSYSTKENFFINIGSALLSVKMGLTITPQYLLRILKLFGHMINKNHKIPRSIPEVRNEKVQQPRYKQNKRRESSIVSQKCKLTFEILPSFYAAASMLH